MAVLEFSEDWHGVPVIDASKAREAFRDVLDIAANLGGRLVIQRNGRPVAALVSMGELRDLLERDERADAAMARAEPDAAQADPAHDTPVLELSTDSLRQTSAPAVVRADERVAGRARPSRPVESVGGRRKSKHVLTGVVISDKDDKTVVVRVERRIKHPLYGKIIKRSKKYYVHDERNRFKAGDTVRIEETQPISKAKTWKVIDLVDTHAAPEQAEVA